MKTNERVNKTTKGDKDRRQHKAQQNSESMIDKKIARDTEQSPLLETPFYSRMDEHAATLSRIPFTVQRQEYIMRLNNTYGLRYVQRLLESVNAQAKLSVSNPGDKSEQEADKVADEVTREINAQAQRQEEEEEVQMMPDLQRQEEEEEVQMMPDLQRQDEEEEVQMMPDLKRQPIEEEEEELLQPMLDLQRQDEEEEVQMMPDLQRQPVEEEEEEEIQAQRQEDEEEELIQMKRDEKSEAVDANEIETRINSAKGNGQPLSSDVKKPMEQAFGADFNDVKIHTGTEADTLNRQLNAKAFTTGQDIFFRDGEYSPDSDGGKKLIAHELTHVVQQTGGRRRTGNSDIRSSSRKVKSNSKNKQNN